MRRSILLVSSLVSLGLMGTVASALAACGDGTAEPLSYLVATRR